MFNKKQEVKCEVCKHKIDKEDAQVVRDLSSYNPMNSKLFFCPMHRVNYDAFYSSHVSTKMGWDIETIFYKRQPEFKRVNEDGTDYKEPKKK